MPDEDEFDEITAPEPDDEDDVEEGPTYPEHEIDYSRKQSRRKRVQKRSMRQFKVGVTRYKRRL